MSSFLEMSAPSRRRVSKAVVIGIIAGVMSMIMKRGWETVLPPRLPDQAAPPFAMLKMFGFDVKGIVYVFSENQINLPVTIVVFSFSTACALFYCIVAEYFPRITLWAGVAYGLFIQIFFHLIVLPLFGWTAAPWDIRAQEHIAEFLGHMLWGFTIEIIRRQLRAWWTREPDITVFDPTPAQEAVAAA